jgi:quinol-cytochrome oxidoreductase complex cytochrome b subunit
MQLGRLQRRHFPFLANLRYIQGMLGKYTTSLRRTPWRIFLGVLCIALIMVGGVVSATHTHSQRETSHQDCGLCVTAHMAVQIAVTVTQVCVAHQVFTRVEASNPVARPQFAPQFALFSRPPPAA